MNIFAISLQTYNAYYNQYLLFLFTNYSLRLCKFNSEIYSISSQSYVLAHALRPMHIVYKIKKI